ncbi:MAG: 30S ribosomal protein S5 [Thermoplasmata archaeon]|nr:30S ribosomal protein S5 [Thermoplasmata archaeon]
MPGPRGGGRPQGRQGGFRKEKQSDEERISLNWVPKTKLGKLVYAGKITSMSEALDTRLPLKEPEIVDILLPELEDEVLDVNMVQRMTDSGRRVRFAITAVVGNGDGFVGMGRAKGKEVGPNIRNAIDRAKLNIIEVKRGCGSWECGCGTPHTFPYAVKGKCGSVDVTFKPAPRGVGLAIGDVAKKVVTMAGIKDAWGFAKGHTKTTVNYSFAAFEALRGTSMVKVSSTQLKNLKIISGPVNTVYLETSPEKMKIILEEKKKKSRESEAKEKAESKGGSGDVRRGGRRDGDRRGGGRGDRRPPRRDGPARDRNSKPSDKKPTDNKVDSAKKPTSEPQPAPKKEAKKEGGDEK